MQHSLATLLSRFRKRESKDWLTGLQTLRSFWTNLDRCKLQQFAVILMDIDNLKRVNDTYGHLVGDDVLRAVASLLSSWTTAYRYGGDEFAVIIEDADTQAALLMAESFKAGVAGLLISGHHSDIRLNLSIGVAVFPEDGITIKEVMRIAERRCFWEAKAELNRTRRP